jgi:hypothetical protein
MAVAACCCGVPMSYCKPSKRVSAGTQTDRSRRSDAGEAGLSNPEQIGENCQQLHARPLRQFDTSVHASARLVSSTIPSQVAAGLTEVLNISCITRHLAQNVVQDHLDHLEHVLGMPWATWLQLVYNA